MNRKLIALIVVLAVVLAGGAYWLSRRSGDGKPKVTETVTLGKGEVRKVLEATGIVKAQVGAVVKIGARATGIIEKMLVKVGDKVAEGDLIAVIDDRELQAQRAEAQARLVRAQVELEKVQQVYPLQIREAQAQQRLANAKQDYASTNLRRQQALVERDVQSKDVLDQARRDEAVAADELVSRQATVARLTAEFVKTRASAERSVKEAEASLNSIDVRISYTKIYSPLTGLVSQVTVQEGETVVSGLQVANLITVIDPTRLEMWVYVDETDVGQVKPGMPVEFRVDAYRAKVFAGNINQLYPEPEIRDNIVYYRALVQVSPEQAASLKPEMTTQCQIVVASKADVLALPNQALKWVGDRQVVFVKDGDGIREVVPTLGLQGLDKSEVTGGLDEGQVVATQVVLPKSSADTKNLPPPSRQGSGAGGGPGGRGR